MQHHLVGVVDSNLVHELELFFDGGLANQLIVEGAVSHQLAPSGLVVDAHDDLVAIDVDVALHQGNWLVEDVIAGADQIDVQDLVVPHDTVDALIVVGGGLGGEGDDDAGLRLGVDLALNLGEGENVLVVSEELEGSRQVTIVDDVEEAVCVGAE